MWHTDLSAGSDSRELRIIHTNTLKGKTNIHSDNCFKTRLFSLTENW